MVEERPFMAAIDVDSRFFLAAAGPRVAQRSDLTNASQTQLAIGRSIQYITKFSSHHGENRGFSRANHE